MALNVTILGNIVDENESPIDCYYDIYYVRQNVLVTGTVSELTQYNFNAGSANHLTQNGELKANDIVLVRFNTNINTTEYNEQFASIAVIYDGVSSQIPINVKLQSVHTPPCNFNISTGTINNINILNIDKTLDYSYIYDGNTMYQRKSLYGYNIFPGLELTYILYNFNGTYITNNSFTYTDIGDKTIYYKSTLPNGTILECSNTLRISYNEPIPDILYSPNSPVLNENLTITGNGTDTDNTVTKVEYIYNGDIIYTGTELDYEYTKIVESLGSINICQKIYWNDGFQDLETIQCKTISTTNQPPVIDPVLTENDNIINIVSNATDPEDQMNYVRYSVYECKEAIFNETYTSCSWVYLDSFDSDITNNFNLDIIFYRSGKYKIEIQAFDQSGLSSVIEERIVDLECSGSGTSSCDFAGVIKAIQFGLKEENKTFGINTNELKFNIKEKSLKFVVQENDLNFKVDKNSPTFQNTVKNLKF